jgi:hypothetical protein
MSSSSYEKEVDLNKDPPTLHFATTSMENRFLPGKMVTTHHTH